MPWNQLAVVVNHHVGAGSFTRATSALICQVISPAPHEGFKENAFPTCVFLHAYKHTQEQMQQSLHVEVRGQL